MILTCPECATRYLIDPAQLAPHGRWVRCAKCSHSWHELPPDDLPKHIEIEPPPKLRPLPPGSNLPALSKDVRRRGVAAGWLVFILLLVIVLGGGYAGRNRLVEWWPPAASIYAALGVPVDSPARLGLALEHLKSSTSEEGGVTVLLVSGEIANITGEPHDVPKMRIALRNAKGQEIYHWLYTAAPDRIPPHGMLKFSSRLSGPPADASDLLITFVGASGKPPS